MMDNFDISELPEHITQYRNRVLAEALERNAPYLQKMMENLHPRQARVMWQQVAQMAVNALSNYMEPRVDSLSQGDDPRVVFYDGDQSEPVRSYVNAWVEGYATRALGGRCSEHEVRPSIEQSGISLYPIDNRVNYAEAILPQRGYSRECVSVAIGHAILSYAISLSDEVSDEEKARFSWKGDIDGFASGWRYAQSHGLGYDSEYIPYSDEDQIDRFMQSLSDSVEDASGQDAGDTGDATTDSQGNAGDDTGVTENGDENNAIRNISEVETSLPDRYATVFDQTGQIQADASGTTGIYIEVSNEQDGIASSASDSAVFTSDDFEDVTEEEILHIKTKTSESSESLTGQQVAIVSESEAEASDDVTERTVRRLPPMFEKYLFLTISSAIRGNASRIAQLTDAGMTFEQSEHLKRKVMSATARYGLKEFALMGLRDGIPAGEDGTEPVRTYANSWLQGYISVITDGEFSQAAIIRAALMSIVSPDSIEQDVEHVLERQQWEGYDDECSMVALAHLRVSLSPHGKGHPLAHAMEGTGRFSRRGATDGFSDGWWKATEIVRRLEEETRKDAAEAEPEPEETREEQTDDSMDKAKEEAKMLLAGLFTEDDILPEESVASLIGPPMPVPVTRVRPQAEPQQEGDGDESDDPRHDGTGTSADSSDDAESPSQQAGRSGHDDRQAGSHGTDATGVAATQPQERKPPTQQERVRKHAEACMTQAVRQRSDLVKRMWTNTGTTREAAKVWTNAVQQATAAYGWHIINDLGANPAKSKDGTRPMLSYASAWISGYVAGFSGDEPTERTIQGISQTLGISLGETGERSSYAQNVCSMKGYGAECLASLLRHMKYEFLMHDGRNPESVDRADARTYNWIADIDGYADGWFVARRVKLQQQRQSQSR